MNITEHLEHCRDVLNRVTFPDYRFIVTAHEAVLFMQVECTGTCNVTGTPKTWKGRKWLLSSWMTDGEIVQTAFKAVVTAAEHEIREQFKYRGATIYDPHYDVEKLVHLRNQPDALKERE